mmetsp:Transcript_7536/g.26375  ORF Transcript_7536/g.26375 Transcript_7536/m.26375 type:complete len:223 (-) Transcript_7536:556-1224(-)
MALDIAVWNLAIGSRLQIHGGMAPQGGKCVWMMSGGAATIWAQRSSAMDPSLCRATMRDSASASPGRTFHDGWRKVRCAATAMVNGGWLLPWCQSWGPATCLSRILSRASTTEARQYCSRSTRRTPALMWKASDLRPNSWTTASSNLNRGLYAARFDAHRRAAPTKPRAVSGASYSFVTSVRVSVSASKKSTLRVPRWRRARWAKKRAWLPRLRASSWRSVW